MEKLKAVRVSVEGRVQGVGFRYSARQEALRRRLKGWVRNEDDGTVSIHAEGPEAAVDAFLAWLEKGPPGALVTAIRLRPLPPGSSYRGFTVEF